MHSSPRRKFQKYAVFVLICPGPNESCTTGAFLLLRVTKLIYSFRCEVDYDRNMLEYGRARSPATNSGWFFIRKLDAFSTPSSVNFDPDNLEDWNLEGWYYVLQNILICNPSDNKWRQNDVITKNNGKMRTSAKPDKLYIIRKVFTRAMQKCTFNFIESEPCPLTTYDHVT